MADSDDEGVDDLDYVSDAEEEPEIDDDLLGELDQAVAGDDATEGDDDSGTDDSDDGSDEDEEDASSPPATGEMPLDEPPTQPVAEPARTLSLPRSIPSQAPSPVPVPPVRTRSLSPAQLRKKSLLSNLAPTRTYTVEAVCALPHPVPTHSLASSLCMTHLLTGSDDGYIRDYDIFSAVNGKNFLTAPQRHHCGVVEGILKSGQVRFWWENPDLTKPGEVLPPEERALSPVYSLAMHSDALWALAGTDAGHINLATVRHEPGRLVHVMHGHRGPVSALSMDHDEMGFFSAGWDGEALQWDLNTGQTVRHFVAHGAQLAGIAVRPENATYAQQGPSVYRAVYDSSRSSTLNSMAYGSYDGASTLVGSEPVSMTNVGSSVVPSQTAVASEAQTGNDSDGKSDASFDPLFDDEPDGEGEVDQDSGPPTQQPAVQGNPLYAQQGQQSFPNYAPQPAQPPTRGVAPPKNAPPLLDPATYATYSPNLLMTASIDGQVILWDRRAQSPGTGVGRLWMSEKTPPWCLSACWSADGGQIYAGRRNGSVDVWDVRQLGRSGPANTPRLMKTLRNPLSSGVVSCVVAFPDSRHIACASSDNLRLWNVADAGEPDASGKMKSGVQFKIIPGHHGGYVSQMLVDPAARFLVSASSNRGWHGESTRTVFVHDIKHVQ